jgi:hypothetical protein
MSGMRWKSLVVGFGLVLVAVTACGGQGESGSGGPSSPSSPPTSVPPSSPPPGPSTGPVSPTQSEPPPPPPDDRMAVPAGQVDFSALPAGFPHEVWVSRDGKTLYVRGEEGGCSRLSAEVREQSAQRVAVNLVQTRSTPKGQMCAMIIRYPVVSVPLDEPLGQRQVVVSAENRPN